LLPPPFGSHLHLPLSGSPLHCLCVEPYAHRISRSLGYLAPLTESLLLQPRSALEHSGLKGEGSTTTQTNSWHTRAQSSGTPGTANRAMGEATNTPCSSQLLHCYTESEALDWHWHSELPGCYYTAPCGLQGLLTGSGLRHLVGTATQSLRHLTGTVTLNSLAATGWLTRHLTLASLGGTPSTVCVAPPQSWSDSVVEASSVGPGTITPHHISPGCYYTAPCGLQGLLTGSGLRHLVGTATQSLRHLTTELLVRHHVWVLGVSLLATSALACNLAQLGATGGGRGWGGCNIVCPDSRASAP
jgi:hypothetical protein